MTGWIEDLGLPLQWPAAPFPQTVWDGGTIWDNGATLWDVAWSEASTQGDVLIQWDNNNAVGDWTVAQGDVQTGQDLETACLVSLFSDAPATPDFVPTDGSSDRRGWWADPYSDRPLGSNLWQLERAKKTRDTLATARRYAQQALQWLIDDGVAKQVVVNTSWVGSAGSTLLGIGIAIVKPDGSLTRFAFGWAWQGLATLSSPVAVPPAVVSLSRVRVR
jgi:phage gp46-like protein